MSALALELRDRSDPRRSGGSGCSGCSRGKGGCGCGCGR